MKAILIALIFFGTLQIILLLSLLVSHAVNHYLELPMYLSLSLIFIYSSYSYLLFLLILIYYVVSFCVPVYL